MTQEILEVYRHSLAHILAKAVIEIFGKENVQYAIGPQIADGMYYVRIGQEKKSAVQKLSSFSKIRNSRQS